MPQKIRVLQCFDCKTYQVDITKIKNRWSCKMCGVKQSVMKVFFCGTAADCRLKAQQMNMERGLTQEKAKTAAIEFFEDEDIDWCAIEEPTATATPTPTSNKWTAYIEENEEEMEQENRPTSNDRNNKNTEYVKHKNKWAAYVDDKSENEKLNTVHNTFEIDKKTEELENSADKSIEISKNEYENKWTEYTSAEEEYQDQTDEYLSADKTELSDYVHLENNTSNECPIYERTYEDDVENVAQFFSFENNKMQQENKSIASTQSFKNDEYPNENKRKCTDEVQLPSKIKKTSKWDKFL